ncbi:DUF4377 domain-containing protein [Algoriphagus kandeliae]|uniref:DUF4377 domain-containing protein n=1 Tax=Algoriphagus kandeliae TaxID=2562278 RepID=A0A4Y9QXU6_9BACT|nr:DUF4377 domain-containing protein [Algoriphagus kandeliae]TFV97294.1 DUF4377 domain-containing protein [Algoriphagus kandeliae]
MKNILLLASFFLFLFSCQTKPDGTEETWWINSAKVDCVGVGPQTCYQIFKGEELDRQNWQLFYDQIEGFDYELGNLYQIRVLVSDKAEPIPADASSKTYKLLEVIQKQSDPSLRLTNSWKVIKVGEIEFLQDLKTGEDLIFEFNASENSYFGNMACNTVRGQIRENDGENLLFGPGATTMMACPDMKTEQAIGKALIETRSYKIENNELVFFDSEGNELIRFLAVD